MLDSLSVLFDFQNTKQSTEESLMTDLERIGSLNDIATARYKVFQQYFKILL